MRLIGQLPDLYQGKEFSNFLTKEGIENQCEPFISEQNEASGYRIWIVEEDHYAQAMQWYEKFLVNPQDPLFYGHAPIDPPKPLENSPNREPVTPSANTHSYKGPLTLFLFFLCIIIFIWQQWTTPEVPQSNASLPPVVTFSEAQKELMFDFPYFYELLDKIFHFFPLSQIQNPSTASPELKTLLTQLNQTTYWEGFYPQLVAHLHHPLSEWNLNGPFFEKIQKGEVWRLFTPCLLHADIFHIFFNLAWLMVLGHQIERRLGAFRYLTLILFSAIFSNSAQYLMSGPNFLGLSGVICAMLGFIWIRQRKAPWEGYILQRSTILFIGIFILGMLLIQIASFFLQLFSSLSITPGIANTAHLVGASIGILLGSSKLFAVQRHH